MLQKVFAYRKFNKFACHGRVRAQKIALPLKDSRLRQSGRRANQKKKGSKVNMGLYKECENICCLQNSLASICCQKKKK